ncbi:D-arabinono-1,4-lactone oxidase [Microbacterium sp. DT81.1]|uniref:D-arabinono-1,4-lactone oxidase n=1 Tax=Microbacterium sp. DT81.1 TaxID=3393413 RepID=UPI003CF90498
MSGGPVGTTWAETYRFTASTLHRPSSMGELRGVITSGTRVRALGTRHSFTDLADSAELVSLERLIIEPVLDANRREVRVSAAMTYGALAAWLEHRGWALQNLASLPHISIGGAVMTATHGSGLANGSLSAAVRALELVTGDGQVLRIDDTDPRLAGVVVSLGAVGVVTRLSLAIVPSYRLRQQTFAVARWADLVHDVPALMSSAYSVSIFTDWLDRHELLIKSREGDADAADHVGSALTDLPDTENVTPRRGVWGPWSERLAHFRMDARPSVGAEIQTEYLVDIRDSEAAMEAVRRISEPFAPHLFVSEIRAVAADDRWLSMAYGRDSLSIAHTWKRHPEAVASALPVLERALEPFSPRPHWGKVFSPLFDVTPLYPQMDAFRSLAGELDPGGVFRNGFTRRVLGLG